VIIPDQVIDQGLVFSYGLGACPITYSCRLNDGGIIPHVTDEPYKSLVQYVVSIVQAAHVCPPAALR